MSSFSYFWNQFIIWSHHPKCQSHWHLCMWTVSIPRADFTSLRLPNHLVSHIIIKHGLCFFKKPIRYGFSTQTDFHLHPLACEDVTTGQIRLKLIPSFTDQTHIILTHCIPAKFLSRNSYIWYSVWRRHRVLIKYPHKCNLFGICF